MKNFNQGTDKVRFRFIKVYSECHIEGNKSLLMYILFHIFDASIFTSEENMAGSPWSAWAL